jgi:hypothetical protein
VGFALDLPKDNRFPKGPNFPVGKHLAHVETHTLMGFVSWKLIEGGSRDRAISPISKPSVGLNNLALPVSGSPARQLRLSKTPPSVCRLESSPLSRFVPLEVHRRMEEGLAARKRGSEIPMARLTA